MSTKRIQASEVTPEVGKERNLPAHFSFQLMIHLSWCAEAGKVRNE